MLKDKENALQVRNLLGPVRGGPFTHMKVSYPMITGVIAAVSQHLYNMGWEHLMDDKNCNPPPDGFLQERWHALYWEAVDAQRRLGPLVPEST